MVSSSPFRKLAGVLEELDRADVDVVDVTATQSDDTTEPLLRADLTIEVSVSMESTTETADVEAPTESAAEGTVPEPVSNDTTEPAGPMTATENDPGEEITDTAASDQTANATETAVEDSIEGEDNGNDDDDTPPAYRDPERLAAVYADYDSFAAMTDALDVEVTPQTVRRHMIDHGIHEPESQSSTDEDATEDGTTDESTVASDDEDADEQASRTAASIPDGIELPDGIDIETLKQIIGEARTIHDIQRELALDRDSTRELLTTLNLLDCVHGRLDEVDREIPPEEIDERIDTATTEGNA